MRTGCAATRSELYRGRSVAAHIGYVDSSLESIVLWLWRNGAVSADVARPAVENVLGQCNMRGGWAAAEGAGAARPTGFGGTIIIA